MKSQAQVRHHLDQAAVLWRGKRIESSSSLNEALDAVMMFIENLQRKCNSIHLHRFACVSAHSCLIIINFALHSLKNGVNVDEFPTVIWSKYTLFFFICLVTNLNLLRNGIIITIKLQNIQKKFFETANAFEKILKILNKKSVQGGNYHLKISLRQK